MSASDPLMALNALRGVSQTALTLIQQISKKAKWSPHSFVSPLYRVIQDGEILWL